MTQWLLFMALGLLAIVLADRAWLRHVARTDLPLHDPDGYLEWTARMTELCHGDRAEVERLVDHQKRRHPQLSHGEAVRLAMHQLLAPEAMHSQ